MEMYDEFSADYDRFVDWAGRLAVEMPFIERQLAAAGAHRVLDAACGTGMHAIALAQRGYDVAGADLSAGMIEQARANAAVSGVAVRFHVAGFGALRAQTSGGFDALLCLGNSLPHTADLARVLADFGGCLDPGGLLVIQNRNFDRVLARHERWMEPQSHREGAAEWNFLRFYDFEADGSLSFHVVTLRRNGDGPWEQRVTSSRLWPLTQAELAAGLAEAGFAGCEWLGDLQGTPFDPRRSPNLVVIARA